MKNDQQYPGWMLWFFERSSSVVQVSLLLAALVMCVAAYFIHRELNSLENQLSFPARPDGSAIETELPDDIAKGQTVYVPAYSHVYHQGGKPFLLTVTLSARNTDQSHEIIVSSVNYYDTQGKLVKEYLPAPKKLAPLASLEILVEEENVSGGSGAKFLVSWVAEENVHEPLIQAVMIGTSGTQGISFTCEGVVLEEAVDQAKKR